MTDLVTIENTHQVGGGSVLPVSEVQAISKVCAAHGVPLYLDGARIFNACTVTGAALADYGTAVTAMMFCLSKGLGAPIGSILTGDREFIREARRLKILFGGAWRQAGILAAAGLVALEEGPSGCTRTTRTPGGWPRGSRSCCRARWTWTAVRDQHRVRRRAGRPGPLGGRAGRGGPAGLHGGRPGADDHPRRHQRSGRWTPRSPRGAGVAAKLGA